MVLGMVVIHLFGHFWVLGVVDDLAVDYVVLHVVFDGDDDDNDYIVYLYYSAVMVAVIEADAVVKNEFESYDVNLIQIHHYYFDCTAMMLN